MFAVVEKIVAVVERMFVVVEKMFVVVEKIVEKMFVVVEVAGGERGREAGVQSMTAEEFGLWKGVRVGREEGGRGERTMVE
jgi:division protein CdvB (Snf7/Vps24/ESCRT-III family)